MCNNLKCTFSANVTFRDCRSAAFATFSEKPCQQSRLRLFFLPIHNFDMCLHDGFVQLQQKNNPNRNVDFFVSIIAGASVKTEKLSECKNESESTKKFWSIL